jgi:hypothetical protein
MVRSEVRLKRVAVYAVATTALLAFLGPAPPARAQLNIPPPFSKLTGGYLWGSLGFRDIQHPDWIHLHDPHPLVRGGFAAMLGPFGGQPDTLVTIDSVRTAVEWIQGKASTPGATRVDTMRTVHALRSHHTFPGVTAGCRSPWAGIIRASTRWTFTTTPELSPRRSRWGVLPQRVLRPVFRCGTCHDPRSGTSRWGPAC